MATDHRQPSNKASIFRKLLALIKRGRRFPHADFPVTYADVRRFIQVGHRCLSELQLATEREKFVNLVEESFQPLCASTGSELVSKPEAFIIDPAPNSEAVHFVNKLMVQQALVILREAAHAARTQMRIENTLTPQVQSGAGAVRSHASTEVPLQTKLLSTKPGPKLNADRKREIAEVIRSHGGSVSVGNVEDICKDLDKQKIRPRFHEKGRMPETWAKALVKERTRVIDNLRKALSA